MLEKDIKVGTCYVNNTKGNALVRKVLSIDSDRVYYQVLSGPSLRKGITHHFSTLRTFAKWAQSPIEELSDYTYLLGFHPQKNYMILDVSGNEFLRCQEKKVKSYLSKNLLKWVDDNTLQFTTDAIEKNMLLVHNGELPKYVLTPKNENCVVCGVKHHLTKHHVVPKKDLKYYPEELKKHLCNRLTVCRGCHNEYEISKKNLHFEDYTLDTVLKWMEHFLSVMKPKFLPDGWHIIGVNRNK